MLSSPVDLALLAGAALLIFGPKRFPEIGKALGQGIGNFKRALTDAQEEVKSAVAEADTSKEKTPAAVTANASSSTAEEKDSTG